MPALPCIVGAAVLAVLLTGAPQAGDPEVDSGVALFERLDYDRAVVVLGHALTRPSLPPADRVRALETLAYAYTVLGDAVNGLATFHKLLDLAPDHRLPDGVSPRLRDAFLAAKRSWDEGRRVGITVDPDPRRAVITLSGDPRRVGEVLARDESGKTTTLACEGAVCRGDRPERPFTVEVLDHRGTVLATAGPLDAASTPGPAWWIWAIAGAAALGATVTIAVAASGGDPPAGTLGRLNLP